MWKITHLLKNKKPSRRNWEEICCMVGLEISQNLVDQWTNHLKLMMVFDWARRVCERPRWSSYVWVIFVSSRRFVHWMIDDFVRKHQHCGKNLWWGCPQVKCIWLILILLCQYQLYQLLRTFAWTSTTTSSSHQDFVFGLLSRSWHLLEEVFVPGQFAEYCFNELKAVREWKSSSWWQLLQAPGY